MLKSVFYFTLKALFWKDALFYLVGERLDKKAKVNLNIYDVTTWITINKNTQNDQYLKK